MDYSSTERALKATGNIALKPQRLVANDPLHRNMNRSYNAAESADIRDTIVPKQKDRLAAVSPNLLALLDVQTLSSFIHSALPKHKACTLVAGF